MSEHPLTQLARVLARLEVVLREEDERRRRPLAARSSRRGLTGLVRVRRAPSSATRTGRGRR
jgi:hypothetical protein